jgi:hypothetical protein
MATKKQKEKKKKDRENKSKARVLARRHQIRSAIKEEAKAKKLEKKFRDKIKPFVKDSNKKAIMDAADESRVKERLERNMQILKALEEEYESEQSKKNEINQSLESQGHETLKDKLNAIEDIARISDGESSATPQ